MSQQHRGNAQRLKQSNDDKQRAREKRVAVHDAAVARAKEKREKKARSSSVGSYWDRMRKKTYKSHEASRPRAKVPRVSNGQVVLSKLFADEHVPKIQELLKLRHIARDSLVSVFRLYAEETGLVSNFYDVYYVKGPGAQMLKDQLNLR